MTYNSDWFNSFKELDGTFMRGDDWGRSIKGSGTVQTEIHDGMISKLDCWYVPELWKNLVSLGILAKNGMRYAGEGEWVTVIKGSLFIMKRKMICEGIYILEGSTVMGLVAIS